MFKITQKIIDTYNNIVGRGMPYGIGKRNGPMCVEAAVCMSTDGEFGDKPTCVTEDISTYGIELNDFPNKWKSNKQRAKSLKDFGIAQLGSKDKIKPGVFIKNLKIEIFREYYRPIYEKLTGYQGHSFFEKFITGKCDIESLKSKMEQYVTIVHKEFLDLFVEKLEEFYFNNKVSDVLFELNEFLDFLYDHRKITGVKIKEINYDELNNLAHLGVYVLCNLKSPGTNWL